MLCICILFAYTAVDFVASMKYVQDIENQNSVETLNWLLIKIPGKPTFSIPCINMLIYDSEMIAYALVRLHPPYPLVEFFAYQELVMLCFS